MFVEIIRLFIVLLATAVGFAIGRGDNLQAGQGAVVGATLGAMTGYVIGGALGRLLRRAMGQVEEQVEKTPAAKLLSGTVGGAIAGIVATMLGTPAVMLLPGRWGWPVLGILVWIGIYYGWRVAGRKTEELLALAGLSSQPLVRASRYGDDDGVGLILDTSAVMDGRLLTIARSGFMRGDVLLPRFVLDELQGLADAAEPTRRRRGQRGLEELEAIRGLHGIRLHITDDEIPELAEVDAKLVTLAKRLKFGLVTVDGNLQKVAELQGIECLNLNNLAESLKPSHLPGETVHLEVSRPGREPGQGIGYLDDGTMVVVTNGGENVGGEVDARITHASQTAVGRMLFAVVDAD